MKLQSYIRIDSEAPNRHYKIALINFAIDSSFLPREFLPFQNFTNRNYPKLVAAIILPNDLNSNNTIDLDNDGEPVLVAAGRFPEFKNSDPQVLEIRKVTEDAINAVVEALNIQLIPEIIPVGDNSKYNLDDDNYFTLLELGGVAHELGTLPLKCHDKLDKPFLVDDDLQLLSRKAVYVCDLSIFPFSPEVNPTLTFVALALRLSREILSRNPFIQKDEDTIYVMKQSGERIKVRVSNLTGAVLTAEEIAVNENGGKMLEPGELVSRVRDVEPKKTLDESVLVYSLQYNSQDEFLPNPVTYVATPGALCVIEL